MDSRGQSTPPSHHHQHHQHHPHHHHQPPQPPPGMMLHHHHHHNNHPYSTPPQMITTPNSSILQSNRFPFTSQQIIPPPQPPQPPSNTPPLQPKAPPSPSPSEPLGSGFSGEDSRQSGFGFDPNSQKKKRGRPRKYSPDSGGNNIALGLTPTPLSPPSGGGGGSGGGQADSGGNVPSSDKKHRGRPPSSSKRQLDALGNCGVGFTPHVILVKAGEDIAQKIIAFSKQGPRTVCVLSANGSICNVSLRQPAHTGGVVNYEGRYELISLTGSFLFTENNGEQTRSGGLSVALADSDGRVLGGGVAGVLMAASPVQIIVGSFIANGKKTKYMPSVPSHASNFAPQPLPAPETPPSQDVSSEGSDENGSNHIDRTMGGSYTNSNHSMHNMHMYNPMGWPNHGS